MMVETYVLAMLLVLFRCAAFLAFAPIIGGGQVPRLVKVGFAMSLAWLWVGQSADGRMDAAVAGILVDSRANSVDMFAMLFAASRETAVGAGLGYLMSLIMAPGRIAGVYIGNEAGMQMATVLDPNSNSSGNVVAELIDVLATMLFFSLNVHHSLLQGLFLMLDAWPVGSTVPQFSLNEVHARVATAHEIGMLAAMPTATLLFFSSCALLMLMRSAPQFSLFSVGQSIRVGIGLFATLMFLPHTLTVIVRGFHHLLSGLTVG